MKSILVGAATVFAAFVVAPAANAAIFTPGDPEFQVTFLPNGTISANIGNNGLSANFEDTFSFTLLTQGLGSGSVSANFTSGLGNEITLTDVLINGSAIMITKLGNLTVAGGDGISLAAGLNNITIRGTASGNVAYGGSITFVPNAVPEPATWAMMLVGFGMVAGASRYRRRSSKTVFA